MNDRLREYVDGLFNGVPMTKETIEFREEVLQNLNEKYADLISQGKSDEAAYNIAVAGVGDIQSILRDMDGEKAQAQNAAQAQEPPKSAREQEFAKDEKTERIMTAIGVALCILCPVPCILWPGAVGAVLLFVLVAAGVAMFILAPNPKQKYKNNVTMAEEFRQWKTEKQGVKARISLIHAVIWAAAAGLYFLISFASGAWFITWVIFLIAPSLCGIASAVFELKR